MHTEWMPLLFFVCHFVYLLFHHVSAAVDMSFLDARDLQGSVFYVSGQLEGYWAEGAGWHEFNF